MNRAETVLNGSLDSAQLHSVNPEVSAVHAHAAWKTERAAGGRFLTIPMLLNHLKASL